jgi:hypothetical protein
MKAVLSFATRLYSLVSSTPPTPPLTAEEETADTKALSVRFSPEVRKFIEHQAAHLQCSAQDIVNLTMLSVARATNSPQATQLELMCARFNYLFDSYHIPMADVPNILQNSKFRRSDLMDNRLLVDALTDDVLLEIAEIFKVNIDWLKGASDKVIPAGGHGVWYKNIGPTALRIANSFLNHEQINVIFVAQHKGSYSIDERFHEAESGPDNEINNLPIGVVIERVSTIFGHTIKKYDVLRYDRWNYDRCRRHLKYLALFCKRTHIRYSGLALSKVNFKKLYSGDSLPLEVLQNTPNEHWNPDIWDLDAMLVYYTTPDNDEAAMNDMSYIEKGMRDRNSIVSLEHFTKGWMPQAFGEVGDDASDL